MVIGANGFLGRNLCHYVTAQGHDVVAVGRQPISETASAGHGTLNYIRVDMGNQAAVATLPVDQVDMIFMMAGKTGTTDGFSNYAEYVRSNELALLNLLDAHVRSGASARIIFPSTRLVYQGNTDVHLRENDPKDCKSIYAANKLACEHYLEAYAHAYDVPFTTYRICVPYGQIIAGPYSYGTLGFMLRQAREDRCITLFGNGSVKRTFTHVADILHVMQQYSQKEETRNKTFNIGSNDNFSLRQLAEMIGKKTGCDIAFKEWPEFLLRTESGDTMFDDHALQAVEPYAYAEKVHDFVLSLDI